MERVRAKKHLGQHFLKDDSVCERICSIYSQKKSSSALLEIGPGMGALTKHLAKLENINLFCIEYDIESVNYLKKKGVLNNNKIIQGDFLKLDLNDLFQTNKFDIIGNFPYNISSQILFKCLEYKNQVNQITGMFQKEVAERICSKPGSKSYGILSVLMQAYYNIEYCFTINEDAFIPPPKVKSAVINCTRNNKKSLPCNEKAFKTIVKTAFNQRRKTLRNALKSIYNNPENKFPFQDKRAEQLSVNDFVQICSFFSSKK